MTPFNLPSTNSYETIFRTASLRLHQPKPQSILLIQKVFCNSITAVTSKMTSAVFLCLNRNIKYQDIFCSSAEFKTIFHNLQHAHNQAYVRNTTLYALF